MSDDLVKRLRERRWPEFLDCSEQIEWKDDDALEAADRIEELEAKLAKAIEALDEAIYLLDPDEEDITKEAGLYRIVKAFKELKGEQP